MKQKLLSISAKALRILVPGLASLGLPVVFFYLMEFYTHNPFEEVRSFAQFCNVVLFELVAWILIFLTGRVRAGLWVEAAAAMLFGIANAYVVRFRTNPLVPWDILSWRTAAGVAGNYDFTPDKRMVIVTLIFLALIAVIGLVKTGIMKFAFWKRLIPAAAAVLALVFFARTLQQESFQNSHRLYNKLFTPVYMTNVDGIAVTFVMNMAYMSIDKPQHYSVAEARGILSENAGDDGMQQERASLPNIIVVMNESFADLSVLGDFEVNKDYMPFLHRLFEGEENTVTGMLNVSVCGGNTANTEFEFLTGNTMAFLPQGSIPYQQYINGRLPSLAEHLSGLGYQTAATHPYNADGWDRDEVYPWMGFDDSLFLEGYDRAYRVRKYVSDESCTDKIIEIYENKEEGSPLFVFQVTMQNHGGYQDLFENFTPEVKVSGVESVSLEQYLSLTELSDQALKHLIDYFSEVDEKTVIIFFGDHQPSDTVAAPILSLNGMKWNHLNEEEQKLRYQVPYVIWANYDIEERQNADTSCNYLAAEALRYAGVPTSAYQNFLLELKEQYPIISAVRMKMADGTERAASEENGDMDIYRKLQYYQLFDRGEMQ